MKDSSNGMAEKRKEKGEEMSNQGFTPGPWKIEWMDAKLYLGEDNVIGEFPVGIFSGKGRNKLYVWRRLFDNFKNEDARLVAAAPDMYEALKLALSFLDHSEPSTGTEREVIDLCKMALAKAEGGNNGQKKDRRSS
jgi:hypothetical protein